MRMGRQDLDDRPLKLVAWTRVVGRFSCCMENCSSFSGTICRKQRHSGKAALPALVSVAPVRPRLLCPQAERWGRPHSGRQTHPVLHAKWPRCFGNEHRPRSRTAKTPACSAREKRSDAKKNTSPPEALSAMCGAANLQRSSFGQCIVCI
jgi:hypothetical protein